MTHSSEPLSLPASRTPADAATEVERALAHPEPPASPAWSRRSRVLPLTREDREHHRALLLQALRGWTIPRTAR
ncbi:hypothetical protein ACIO3O_40215 [Streptomyces sp. NPDC087440]|uniref:hypothetical protein n=1 Tax=Streptomyces sp. NPDC087440 TaxID=3365790 RepID=UPI003810538A